MTKNTATLLTLAGLVLTTGSALAQNLVSNGNFTGTITGWTVTPGAEPNIGGWQWDDPETNASNLGYSGDAAIVAASFTGTGSALNNNNEAAGGPDLFSQSINGLTAAALTGEGFLSLWVDVRPATRTFANSGPATLSISLGGTTYATFITDDTSGATFFAGLNGATLDTGSFTASIPNFSFARTHVTLPYSGADTSTLQFSFSTPDNDGTFPNDYFAIDNVILVPASAAAVPEPSATLLGLADAAGMLARRGRRKA